MIKTPQFVGTTATSYQSTLTFNSSLQQHSCKNMKESNQYLSDTHTHTHTHTHHTYIHTRARKASTRYEYACARMCVYTYIHIRSDSEKYVHINTSLTSWCRVLLEKLTGLQLVKKFSAFHGTRRFITAFTSVRHLSLYWASLIQSIYPHPTSWRSIINTSRISKIHNKSCDSGCGI